MLSEGKRNIDGYVSDGRYVYRNSRERAVIMETRLIRKEKAQGMVEFALVLPLLLLVMFAVVEFGRLLLIYSAVFSASRDAARYGAASGSPGNYIPYYQECAGMRAAARRFGSLVGIQDTNITISYDDGSGNSLGVCPSGATNVRLGSRVVVQVTAQYQPILPLVRLPSFPITARAARTVLKDINIAGTPSAPTGTVNVCFESSETTVSENDDEALVRVRLSALYAEDVLVPFSVSGGTATNGIDYSVTSTSPLLIRSGATLVEIHISVNQDDLDEEDIEDVILSLGDPTNAGRCTTNPTHRVKITDDDPMPEVTFTASSQDVPEPAEGNSVTVQVTAQLSQVSGRDVSVPFFADPALTTAAVGSDYVFDTTSPLVIPAGQLVNRIYVRIVGDNMDENDEIVQVAMGTPVNATPGAVTSHAITILDDDLPPFVSFTWSEQEVAEDAGEVGIQLSLSAASGKEISVPYSLDGTATLWQDYSIPPSPLVIPPGQTTVNLPVEIYLDDLEEPDETLTVTMGVPTDAFLGTPAVHTMVIREQIEPPTVSFAPMLQQVAEAGGSATVAVQLSKAYYRDVTVPFVIEGSARLGVDYQITPSPVVIPAGSASALIEINVIDDIINEADETVKLTLGEPVNAIIGTPDVHETVIIDDDPLPTVYFISPSQQGNEAVGVMLVTVRLSNITGVDVLVPFSVGGSATEGSDYTLSPTRLLTIPAGYQEATIRINVVDDDSQGGAFIGEPDETIVLTRGEPINAVLGAGYSTHTATITAWVCPTVLYNPSFESGDSKRLVWGFSYTGVSTVDLVLVTVSWPTHGGVKLDGITFGGAGVGASSYYPNSSGNLTVNNPSPLWRGVFSTRQMAFLFSKNPDLGYGSITVTARFDHCLPLTGSISR